MVAQSLETQGLHLLEPVLDLGPAQNAGMSYIMYYVIIYYVPYSPYHVKIPISFFGTL